MSTKVKTGKVRLSYVQIFEKRNGDNEKDPEGFYSTSLLIPKSDKETVTAIKEAVEAATKLGVQNKWGGKKPKDLKLPLNDGDEKDDEAYHDHYYLNAKRYDKRPEVVRRDKSPVDLDLDREEVYSGVYAFVTLDFYPFDKKANKGVACGLRNIQLVADGEPLGGMSSSAADDFEELSDDDDEYDY